MIRPPVFSALSLLALLATASPFAAAQSGVVRNGEAGFVVAHIEYALSKDASETGACPNGMTEGYGNAGEVFYQQPQLLRADGELEDAHGARVQSFLRNHPEVRNLCQNPELGRPDPRYKTVTGPDVPVNGIDLDARDSRSGSKPAPGYCAHEDFRGTNGERGIDNQFFRVMGCDKSFQSTGLSNTFATEMLTGSWGILITLSGVDDIRNDDHVTVGFYSNADPIRLSPRREPLAYASYTIEPDPRYQATASGRIRNGVLTTEPTNMRFHWVVNAMHLDRPLNEAVVRMTLGEDGVLEGYLAGYTPVEELYDFMYGFRNATDNDGNPAPLARRVGSSIGKSRVLGYTCEGVYHALYENADRNPDPATGHCTSISTQYRIKAIPAFVMSAKGNSDE